MMQPELTRNEELVLTHLGGKRRVGYCDALHETGVAILLPPSAVRTAVSGLIDNDCATLKQDKQYDGLEWMKLTSTGKLLARELTKHRKRLEGIVVSG